MKIKNKTLRQIHIYCSLICCTLLLVFALTGISLNHRDLFEGNAKIQIYQLPLVQINAPEIERVLSRVGVVLSQPEILILVNQREYQQRTPGKRLELYIESTSEQNQLMIEAVDLGLVGRLNELHQNRYTSMLWQIISDLCGVIFILISATGIWLSLRDKKHRRNYLILLSFSFASFILLME